MANIDAASGLSPVSYLNGSPWSGGGRVYSIASGNTDIFAIGDPVVLEGGADANGIATVALATAGITNSVLGSIISGAGALGYGGSYGIPQESPTVIPSVKTRAYYVLVADDPNTIFEIQEVTGGTALTAAAVGLNAPLIAGTNNGYVSGWELNNVGETAGGTEQLKLLGLAPRADNAFGEHAKWLVLINLHCYRIGQVGYS